MVLRGSAPGRWGWWRESRLTADRFAAIHGLFWLCGNRAERGPLVLVVDDVQWVDDPSLAWLGYLARRVGDLAVLLVLALRWGDPGGERAELVSVADRAGQRIALGPLSATAVAAMTRAQLGEDADERFCAACGELSGGNPLFVRELLAAAREQGLGARGEMVEALRRIAPSAVGTSVLTRLGRLGEEAVAIARAVAVLGPGTEVALAARLAELDPVVAELTADRLAAAQILAPGRPLEFFHPLIAAAVRDDIAPGARRVAHRRAAELVGAHGEGSLARVAAHLLVCGPGGDAWVVARLCDAAMEALDRGAPDVAASYLRRALAEPPVPGERARLMLWLGTAEWRAVQPDATAHLEQALAAAGEDLGTLIAACGVLAVAYAVSDQTERATGVLERALAAVADPDAAVAVTDRLRTVDPRPRDHASVVGFEASLAWFGMLDERTAPTALRRAERLRSRLDSVSSPSVHLLAMLAYHAARVNRAAEAQALAERALACEPYPPPFEVCPALLPTLTQIECFDAVHRLCNDLLAPARRRGSLREFVTLFVFRARASSDCGALVDAEADAGWALERADGVFRTIAVSEVIRVLIERDELEAAETVLAQHPDPSGSSSINVTRFLIARGRLRAAEGRLQDALDDFLDCGQRCARLGIVAPISAPWRAEAALLYTALGHPAEAHRLAGEQLELARQFGRPRTLGISLRAAGLVQTGAAGLELLREAVNTLERSHARLELARALTDHGAMLRRAGQRTQARAQLERGLDLAHHLAARRIANQARAELITAGAKPRRDAITGRDALTPGELRVARLAAEGLTNREIAQALFITTKTAKAHLSRVYRKLEITRRGQLVGALTGLLEDGHDDPIATEAIS